MTLVYNLSRHCKNIANMFRQQFRFQQTQAKPRFFKYHPFKVVPVFRKAADFSDRIALRDNLGNYTYANIFMGAKELSKDITKNVGGVGTSKQRVLFLCPNDGTYLITQWAIWISGQIAVPVSYLHPQSLLEYYCRDCNAKLLVTTPQYAELIHKVAKNTDKEVYVLDEKLRENASTKIPTKPSDLEGGLSADFYNRQNAMILYTSGTTGSPKGVVLSHRNLTAQITTLVDAWKWSSNDTILHTLPLHHVHGITNGLLCPLFVGARCVMLPKYDSNTVWAYLLGLNANPDDRKITVFMAVPTIYSKLIDEYERVFTGDYKISEHIKNTLKTKVRLMVSGSAPLPKPVYERWLKITGHKLLERYGMTEIGMCLSHTYDSNREPGYLGIPLPGVSVKVISKQNGESSTALECTNNNGKFQLKLYGDALESHVSGELLVKGESVFKEYFNKPDVTSKEFTADGWFKTGDICQYSIDKQLFQLLGRSSVDIIKTGGYKVSAIEIETNLLGHPDIADCTVVGLKCPKWGEKVAAVVVLREEASMTLESLKEWTKTKMAEYSVPKVLLSVEVIPKNAMGKVNKKEIIKKFFP